MKTSKDYIEKRNEYLKLLEKWETEWSLMTKQEIARFKKLHRTFKKYLTLK